MYTVKQGARGNEIMIGKRIRYLMKIQGISKEELVKKSGVPDGTLKKILYGETVDPGLKTVFSIAKALNCKVDDFLRDDVPSTIAAHHDEDEWTDEEREEVERFKEYVRSKRKD